MEYVLYKLLETSKYTEVWQILWKRTQWKKLEIHRDETQVVNKHVKIDNDVNGSKENTKLNPMLSKIMTPEDVPGNWIC